MISAGSCGEALPHLGGAAAKIGLVLSPAQKDLFVRYCEMVLAANQQVNLTGAKTADGVMATLILESLTISLALPDHMRAAPPHASTLRVVDVGAGAGIPGIPLKVLYPFWKLALIESIGKKARFLEKAIRDLGLAGTTVMARRAEDCGRERAWRDSADLCLARAVAPLASLVELCAPLVRTGGLLAFPKSGDVAPEVDAARPAARALRVEFQKVVAVPAELGLPPGRTIVVGEKKAATPSGYPRRTGLAQSRPIGR